MKAWVTTRPETDQRKSVSYIDGQRQNRRPRPSSSPKQHFPSFDLLPWPPTRRGVSIGLAAGPRPKNGWRRPSPFLSGRHQQDHQHARGTPRSKTIMGRPTLSPGSLGPQGPSAIYRGTTPRRFPNRSTPPATRRTKKKGRRVRRPAEAETGSARTLRPRTQRDKNFPSKRQTPRQPTSFSGRRAHDRLHHRRPCTPRRAAPVKSFIKMSQGKVSTLSGVMDGPRAHAFDWLAVRRPPLKSPRQQAGQHPLRTQRQSLPTPNIRFATSRARLQSRAGSVAVFISAEYLKTQWRPDGRQPSVASIPAPTPSCFRLLAPAPPVETKNLLSGKRPGGCAHLLRMPAC